MIYLIRRFAAFYVDMVLVMIIVYTFYTLYFLNIGTNIEDVRQPNASLSILLQFLGTFSYFLFSEFFFEKTIGKVIFKFVITGYDENKGLKRFIQVLKRTLIRLIPLDPFSILLNEEFKTWHDLVSKTKVIDTRKNITQV
ncbi:MAG: RDD family protein [Prolixibacteraceae bacterium]|nr:RDD family protein [Prolixibacteraceae bacterium]